MLKGIPRILPPELLKMLAEMGHGDQLTIGDANFPGHACGCPVIRMDGHSGTAILEAILELFPLDHDIEYTAALMDKAPGVQTPIWDEYAALIETEDPRGMDCIEKIERFKFYEAAKRSYVVIMSGETALYGNLILTKGVIK